MANLPWAKPFRRRCKARLLPNYTGYHGRCELEPHNPVIKHALERGMDWIRWPEPSVRIEQPHYEIRKKEI